MPYSSLLEAIAKPPDLISAKALKRDDQNKKSKVKDDVLLRWSERASVQEFMNAVSALSLKRQQQIEQQQKLQEQIQQRLHKQQLQLQERQKQEQLRTQKEQNGQQNRLGQPDQLWQQDVVDSKSSFGEGFSETVQSALKDGTRQKVKKVMKGGVLVSMPISTRQTLESINSGGKGYMPFANYKDKAVDFGAGNILDDILARTKNTNDGDLVEDKVQKKTLKLNDTESAGTISTNEELNDKKTSGNRKVVHTSNPGKHSTVEELRSEASEIANRLLAGNTRSACKKQNASKVAGKSVSEQTAKVKVTKDKLRNSKTVMNDETSTPTTDEKTTCKSHTGNLKGKSIKVTSVVKPAIKAKSGSMSLVNDCKEFLSKSPVKVKADGNKAFKVSNSTNDCSDSESVASDDLVIAFDTSQDSEDGICRHPAKRAKHESISSESSEEDQVESSFDRIRALQLNLGQQAHVSCNVEAPLGEGPSNSFSIQSNQDHSSSDECEPEATLVSRNVDKNQAKIFESKTKINVHSESDLLSKENADKSNSVIKDRTAISRDEDIHTSQNDVEALSSQPETYSGQMSIDLQEFGEISAEIPGNTCLTEAKTEDSCKNERKRKEFANKLSPVQTKKKRQKRTPQRNNVNTTGCRFGATNTRGSIQTKRKRQKNTKKSQRSVPSAQYQGCVTRSRTHSDTSLSPPTVKKQGEKLTEAAKLSQNIMEKDSISPKLSLQNKGASMSNEMSESGATLLSLVSDQAMDVTVAQKELADKRKSVTRGGKKKKKKKPTEWFLRQQRKAKELAERNTQAWQDSAPVMPVCHFYLKGICRRNGLSTATHTGSNRAGTRLPTCPNGAQSIGPNCRFRHEKTQDLCIYYARQGKCLKLEDGMCPNLHDEFPCVHYHHKRYCRFSDDCNFSHQPLTPETTEILNKHLATLARTKECLQQTEKSDQASDSCGTGAKGNDNEIVKGEKNDFTEKKNDAIEVTASLGNSISAGDVSPDVAPPLTVVSGLNNRATTLQTTSKPVESPRVKRLCSLSTYKSPILSSFGASSNLSMESKSSETFQTTATETKRKFLPGMFKER